MTDRFRSFVIFAEMRTGSNFLEANLEALDGVSCLGELFNPHFIGKKDQSELFGISIEARDAAPEALLDRIDQRAEGLAGFRFFHDHDPRVLDRLLDDPSRAKIILTRNPAESYVSWKIAQATGQWKLTNARNLRSAQARFDPVEFEDHVAALQAFQVTLLHRLQVSGQTAFWLDYEDIQDVDVLNGLAAFLGVAARLDAPDGRLKKQNPEELLDKVENPEAMEAGLARLDRFNLARTPNFEPRRAPAIPSFMAPEGVGLLHMPMRSGPEARVEAWLRSLSPTGQLIDDFVQKSLRQWKRAHPGHRSFTVLRHPLARAHDAFHRLIVSGRAAEHRGLMMRMQKVDLPAAGKDFADLDAEREAFMAFLRHARLNVSGQTGLRVPPNWASQTAVLQGFAGFQGPDLVLREERLGPGLAYLASELDLVAPPVPPADPMRRLDAIWVPELETLAEQAWARDYMAFGFEKWRK